MGVPVISFLQSSNGSFASNDLEELPWGLPWRLSRSLHAAPHGSPHESLHGSLHGNAPEHTDERKYDLEEK